MAPRGRVLGRGLAVASGPWTRASRSVGQSQHHRWNVVGGCEHCREGKRGALTLVESADVASELSQEIGEVVHQLAVPRQASSESRVGREPDDREAPGDAEERDVA